MLLDLTCRGCRHRHHPGARAITCYADEPAGTRIDVFPCGEPVVLGTGRERDPLTP